MRFEKKINLFRILKRYSLKEVMGILSAYVCALIKYFLNPEKTNDIAKAKKRLEYQLLLKEYKEKYTDTNLMLIINNQSSRYDKFERIAAQEALESRI